MLILHHQEHHLTLLPVNRKYITVRLQWQFVKLWSCRKSEQRMLTAQYKHPPFELLVSMKHSYNKAIPLPNVSCHQCTKVEAV
jgi:hypothetical protein